jgi:hypothetical protein
MKKPPELLNHLQPDMEKLYKLLQYSTMGWEEVYTKLTYEQCSKEIQNLLAEGTNPQYIKVVSDEENVV